MKEEAMFNQLTSEIEQKMEQWSQRLLGLSDEIITERRNGQNRNVRQILGHLTDSAVNNHHRIVRLQYAKTLVFPDYRLENDRWIAIQNFEDENFENLVSFWKLYNLHMSHIIKNVDPNCLENTWHDVDGAEETLKTVIEGYLWHLNLHLKEIETLIDR